VARAFAWTHKNIAKYGGRPDRIFACGHSAGGHLVALLATNETYLKAEGLAPKDLRGVIPISGVYNIGENMMPRVFPSGAEERKSASPLRQVKEGLPPFFILYADKDFPDCGKAPSEAFCKALKEKEDRADTLEIKESNHIKIIVSAATADDMVHKKVLEFILTNAKK
jgi:acetyl esterase/lipase